MALADWTLLGGSLSDIRRAVTYGIEKPPSTGTNNFLYGFSSTTTVPGAVAWHVQEAGFIPTATLKGGSIRACVKRGVSNGDTGFSPFLFAAAQDDDTSQIAYMLGLSDEEPHHIVLAKGLIKDGVPISTDAKILMVSSETFLNDTWHHLRMDLVANGTGDVLIDVKSNDLSANPVNSAPAWEPVDGMDQFVDDILGVNSGSLPLIEAGSPPAGGFMGFGFWSNNINRRGYFDHIECLRQV